MIKSSRVWLIAAALVAGLLIAAACGGGGSDNGDEGPTATASSNGGGDEPTATASADTGNDNGDAAGALQNFADEFGQQEMHVTYEFTSSIDGSSGSFVIYWQPPDNWRVDIISDEGEASIIQNADGTYLCTPDAGGSCLASPVAAGTMPVPFLSAFTNPDEFDSFIGSNFQGVNLHSSSDTIAGVSATCYSGSAEGGTGEVCFADNGILLRIRASDPVDGDFTFEATEVSDQVSDSDLEPPYPIQDLGDLIPEGVDIPNP